MNDDIYTFFDDDVLHILQRHPTIARNAEVQVLMDEFSKLVGPSSEIYRSDRKHIGNLYREEMFVKRERVEEAKKELFSLNLEV